MNNTTKYPYYTLLIQSKETGLWGVEFGDFDRETVEDERDCTWRDSEGYKLNQTKIIKTAEVQKEIDHHVAELNKEVQSVNDNGLSLTQLRRIWTVNAVNSACKSIINDIAYDYVQDNWDVKVNGDLKKKHDDVIKAYLRELEEAIKKMVFDDHGEKINFRIWYRTDHLHWGKNDLRNPKIIFEVDGTYKDGPYTQSYIKDVVYVGIADEPRSEHEKHEIKKSQCNNYKQHHPNDVAEARRDVDFLEKEVAELKSRILDRKREFGHEFFKTR